MKTLRVFFLQLFMGALVGWAVPAHAAELSGIASIYAGSNHSCALTGSGAAYCWGHNTGRNLSSTGGDTLYLATKVDLGADVVQISMADRHTCALHKDGTVSCWGISRDGQVGNGIAREGTFPQAKVKGLEDVTMLGSGWSHTCALTRGGSVYCWGKNKDGEAIPNGPEAVTSPTAVPGLEGVSAIGVGWTHTCALRAGMVSCWGNNRYSQLGEAASMTNRGPVQVPGLTDVTRLTAGAFHNCVMDAKGQVKCWGLNRQGQLGDGTNRESATPRNIAGPAAPTITSLVAGGHHTCTTNGARTYCWGNNRHGQMGNEVYAEVNAAPMLVNKLSPLKEIAAGGYHNCAVTVDGKVQCWGGNRYGQMGSGSGGNISPVVMARD